MNISVTRFRTDLIEYLETVQQEPVIIEKYGKPIVALVSYQIYSAHRKKIKPMRAVLKSVQKELAGYLETTYEQPVMVESKPGLPVAVMVSYQTYQRELELALGDDLSVRVEKLLPAVEETRGHRRKRSDMLPPAG
jgi:prevent-host-death family protein